MNQILVTEKLYVTPELKRKKRIYKLELFLSVFLICLLFSYYIYVYKRQYIYAEYDRNKSEEVSKEILAEIKEQVDTTVKKDENDKIVVILEVPGTQEDNEDKTENQNNNQTKTNNTKIDTKTYTSKDGVKYTTEAILKIPKINIEYPVLSATSDALLFVSLNKYWGPQPNEVGNYCIVGHYYENGKMFGKLHKLKNGDKAELTDLSGNTLKYQVYNKYVVEPSNKSCTSQLTGGKKEITLITCTDDSQGRYIIKAREVK